MPDRVTLVDTRRLAQLTGDRDPQDWPMMNVTGDWDVVGVDEGPTTEHDGKLFIFFGDVATSDNGGHHLLGWNFILPNNMQGATGTVGQPDWRLCGQCNGLFFAPQGNAAGSVCPLGGEHLALGWTFYLPNNMQGATDATGQRDWHFCSKCHGLFYAPQQDATGTVCPAGNQHQPEGWVFYLPSHEQGASPDSGQPDWRFCGICHGLSWTGAGSTGTCPASAPGGFRLHPVMRDGQNFDPVRAAPPVGITKSLERPGGPFSYEGRAYTFANISAPVYSEQVRFGNPIFGNYLISKADPAQPGPFDTHFLFSPRIGACPTGPGGTLQSHQALGLSFILPHDTGQEAALQSGWRHCQNCEALFFSGDTATTGGLCWATRQPHDGTGSDGYQLPVDGTGLQSQGAWMRCGNCAVVVWTGDTTSPPLCPGGTGHHSPAGPELHLPYYTDTSGPPPDDPHNQSGWRSCVSCHGLVYTYLEDRFAGAVPHLVSNSVVPGLPPTTAEYGLVILGWGWRPVKDGGGDFRLAWMPLFPGSPPRLQDTMYYTGDPSTPWSPHAGQAKDLWFHYDYTSIGFTWLDQLQRWLLLTTNARDMDPVPGGDDPRARPIVARLAATPWELASADEVPVFDPTVDYPSQPKAYGSYMHLPGSDQIPQKVPPPDDRQGWAYGAYPLGRFITWHPGTQELVLYYLLSLSRPYQVQVMKSTLRIEG